MLYAPMFYSPSMAARSWAWLYANSFCSENIIRYVSIEEMAVA